MFPGGFLPKAPHAATKITVNESLSKGARKFMLELSLLLNLAYKKMSKRVLR